MAVANVEREVALHAAGHHGLVPRSVALSLGMTQAMIHTRLAKSTLIQVGRGLYRIGGAPVTWEQNLLATCLLGGRGAVASHKAAGALWGLSGINRGRPEVTLRRGANPGAAMALGRVHTSRRLASPDVTTRGGIPVTRPVRTVIDLSSRLSAEALTEVVDDAVCRRCATIDQISARLANLKHHPGAAKLALVLAKWQPGPPPDSIVEVRVERCLIDRGLPPPVRQHRVALDGGRHVRLDLAWPEQRVGLELQSLHHHGSPEQFHDDRRRILELRALGWDILEVTPRLLEEDQGARMCKAVARTLTCAMLDE
ncbi:MAG: hypothetical protein ACRDX8_10095 [Acidimicrobiales bacterium]